MENVLTAEEMEKLLEEKIKELPTKEIKVEIKVEMFDTTDS